MSVPDLTRPAGAGVPFGEGLSNIAKGLLQEVGGVFGWKRSMQPDVDQRNDLADAPMDLGLKATPKLLQLAPPKNEGDKFDPGQWYTKDPEKDGVEGTRADRAYAELGLSTTPSPKPVIVAVIDSGVDTTHEDLQGKIWNNKGEIPGDGIDNDGNGYIDDVEGWNFLGSVKDGKVVNIVDTTLEVTREKVRLDAIKAERPLTEDEKAYLKEINATIRKGKRSGLPWKYFDEDFDPRAKIIGDDPYDYSHQGYGNNHVQGPGGTHGTHVAGIIAAIRDNALGTMGIAADVKIMPLRAVPDGDEYDKDVINAVRYAVDNGASIINMSFGKGFSSSKKAVDEAFAYAAANDVLIVHAAGNNGKDLDDPNNIFYPHRFLDKERTQEIPGWLEVSASGSKQASLAARFSNYGKKGSNVFAPGVGLRAPVPKTNRYDTMSGTSMASPVVAGVGAVIRSQYPQLSAVEVDRVIESSVRKYDGLKVRQPVPGRLFGGRIGRWVEFSDLSTTGGVVDLLSALQEASRVAAAKEAGSV